MHLQVVMIIIANLLVHVASQASEENTEDGISTRKLLGMFRELRDYVKLQDERIQTLESLVDEQSKELDTLRHKHNEELPSWRDETENESSSQSREVRANPISTGRGIRAGQPKVAFSSYIGNVIQHIGIDSIIPFHKVLINDGGAYNPITGIFNVPVTGVYLFTYTVNTKFEAYQLVVKLVLDGVNMSDGTSDPFHHNQELQGGNTVIFRARTGQSVWLAAYNIGDTTADSLDDHRYCTFSGVLLYTDD